ncbi:tetratricopeptide repeat protein [Chryseobacterium sp. CT-SW4]|uniref:tetratricopeptide repeat protein n=1 Tax=Chryseobacterium sp. SW-1 TaxID=3157343 RepID=UPI003B02D32E
MKKIFYILFFFLIIPLNAQSIDELDSLTEKMRLEGKIKESINLNKKAIKGYEKQNATENLINAYINLGSLLWNLHSYKESLLYLERAENKMDKNTSSTLNAKLYAIYGRNYTSLGLLEQSNSTLSKAIFYAHQIEDNKKKERYLYVLYTWKINNFESSQPNSDSINFYQKKRLTLSPQPLTYVHIAEQQIKNKKLDSAEFYLNKAANLPNGYRSPYQKSMTLMGFGKLYTKKGNYEKALEFYLSSLKISEQLNRKDDIKNAYKFISDTYKSLNNTEKKNEYLEKYIVISDSIIKSEKEALAIPIDKIIQEETKKEKEQRNKFFALFASTMIVLIFVLIVLGTKYLKKQKQKDEILIETIHETDELKSKLNAAFEELSKLAMHNDPFFLTRFKEVYPDFYERLTTQYPHLTANDIKFCAFLRMNLSTKTIAKYKNISVRTIESRKYRLRKKLSLSSDIDLNKWMMDL